MVMRAVLTRARRKRATDEEKPGTETDKVEGLFWLMHHRVPFLSLALSLSIFSRVVYLSFFLSFTISLFSAFCSP